MAYIFTTDSPNPHIPFFTRAFYLYVIRTCIFLFLFFCLPNISFPWFLVKYLIFLLRLLPKTSWASKYNLHLPPQMRKGDLNKVIVITEGIHGKLFGIFELKYICGCLLPIHHYLENLPSCQSFLDRKRIWRLQKNFFFWDCHKTWKVKTDVQVIGSSYAWNQSLPRILHHLHSVQ